MLVLLLLALQVFAKDVSKTSYEIRRVDKCPEVGYFFKRDLVPNSLTPGPCFLCFCQNNGTAICWRRENNRCNVESYHRHHVGRRETTVRKRPFDLNDVISRDAVKKVFKRKAPRLCQPFESSYNKDCIPENVTESLLNIVVTTAGYPIPTSMKSSFNSTTMIQNTVTNNKNYKYSINNYLHSSTTPQTTLFNEIHRKNESINKTDVDDKANKTTNAINIGITKDIEITNLIDNMLRLDEEKGQYLKEKLSDENIGYKHNSIIGNYEPLQKISSGTVQKKYYKIYKIKKILNRTHSMPISSYKLSKIQSILKQLLKDMNNKNAMVRNKTKTKKYKINMLKIIKKIMKKLYSGKNTRNNVSKNAKKNFILNKQHILKIICGSMGPCNIKPGYNLWFKSKIKELDAETKNILRTTKTIKGLLHLIDIPKKYIDEVAIDNSKFDDDLNKLTIILKGTYLEDSNVSDTHIIQIGFIKKHTQDFIKSFGKCVAILNEMITILTVNNNDTNIGTDIKKDGHLKQKKYLSKQKSLFLGYNMLPNTFMKRMYQLLIGIDNNSSKNKSHKVSHIRDLNSIVAIDESNRLIKNLRRLKTLAQIPSSSRRKRQTRDEDTIDYMLIMMDYLLKHKTHLNAAPVNDGIDLLIETIKNAPDIKITRRKVLENTPLSTMIINQTMKPMKYTVREENKSNYYKIVKNEHIVDTTDSSKHEDIERNVEKELIDISARKKTEGSNTKKYQKSIENTIDDSMENVIEFTTEAVNGINYKENIIENVNKAKKSGIDLDDRKDKNLTDDNFDVDKVEKPVNNHNDRNNDVFTSDHFNVEKLGIERYDRKNKDLAEKLNVDNVDKPDSNPRDRKNEVLTGDNFNVEKLAIYHNDSKNEIPADKIIVDTVEKPGIDSFYKKYGENVNEKFNYDKIEKSSVYLNDEGEVKKQGFHSEDKKYAEHENLSVNSVEKLGVNIQDTTYEVYTADNDYDIMQNVTNVDDITEVNLSEFPETTTDINTYLQTYQPAYIKTNKNDISSGYRKSKLDWIEEAYDREMMAYKEANNTTTTTPKPEKFTKDKHNVSEISKEVDNGKRKKKPNINIDKVLQKKQFNLLSSLDYATERSDFDDPDSKEGPDSGDSFSTYFL